MYITTFLFKLPYVEIMAASLFEPEYGETRVELEFNANEHALL